MIEKELVVLCLCLRIEETLLLQRFSSPLAVVRVVREGVTAPGYGGFGRVRVFAGTRAISRCLYLRIAQRVARRNLEGGSISVARA